ncbi:hypothetical protein Tco_0736331 [Tanacetum coccineum]
MRTRSQSREQRPPPEEPPVIIEPLRIEYPFQEDPHVEPMADTRTMAQLLQAPTEGYEDAILIPEIVANNFELRHGLINLVQNKQFFDKKNQASASAPAPAPVKAVELSCVTCGGAHSHQNCPATHGDVYRDNISEDIVMTLCPANCQCPRFDFRVSAPIHSPEVSEALSKSFLGGHGVSEEGGLELRWRHWIKTWGYEVCLTEIGLVKFQLCLVDNCSPGFGLKLFPLKLFALFSLRVAERMLFRKNVVQCGWTVLVRMGYTTSTQLSSTAMTGCGAGAGAGSFECIQVDAILRMPRHGVWNMPKNYGLRFLVPRWVIGAIEHSSRVAMALREGFPEMRYSIRRGSITTGGPSGGGGAAHGTEIECACTKWK